MSESPDKTDKPLFTEKEEKVLKVAWACLKSGPPDVDMEKLMKAAGFNTLKTTSNTVSTGRWDRVTRVKYAGSQ